MTHPAIDEMLLQLPASLREALRCIDRNAQGICFAVAEDGTFFGTITDGDVRRALLRGLSLDAPASDVANRDAVTVTVGASPTVIQSLLSSRISHVPLLDRDGVPVDYASRLRLRHIPVLEPLLGGRELEYVTECIETNWISSQGRYVRRFEHDFSALMGGRPSLAVTSGTTALHLAMVALGIGPGDEVIVPSFTFAASANTVLQTGARPVLVDVDPRTWTLSVDAAAAACTPATKAIMPVHIYGNPCDMEAIWELAAARRLLVVEDAAEALGSTYDGRPAGTLGDAAAFSFFGNKLITTGEGGMVVFKDAEVAARAARLRDHGMSPDRKYWHDVVGFNYRMTNLQAAIGVAQLERFDALLAARQRTATRYAALLDTVEGVSHQQVQARSTSSWWLYTVLVEHSLEISRDEMIAKLMRGGVESRPTFEAMHVMPPYRGMAASSLLPVSERIASTGLSLPSAASLTDEEQDLVVGRLRSVLDVRWALRERSDGS